MAAKNKPLWQSPWGYKESFIFLLGILLMGIILQVITGNFPFSLFLYPVNMYCGIILIALLIIFSFWSNHYTYKWISGIPFSVSVIILLLLLVFIMGITPQLSFIQYTGPKDLLWKLGFRNMTSSWPFVLIYFCTLFSLGTLILRRIKKFNLQDYAFHLNHIGLWIILFFGGLGAADIKRFEMFVEEGKEEWRVYNDKGDVLALPIAIHLNDFIMEEYDPKLVIIDRKTGTPLPEKKPEYFQIDKDHPHGNLGKDYEITIKQYIQDAIKVNEHSYKEIKMDGACPAALVSVKNKKTGKTYEGWISSGSPFLLYKVLNLSEKLSLVMTQPEPKKFLSDITVYTQPANEKEQGKTIHHKLEVNKPLRIGDWNIYQYSYDTKAGKLSKYSSFELVYDPWVYYVYTGMALLGCGCICLLWKGKKKMKK